MDNMEEPAKYRIENQRLTQGQVIGDHATVYINTPSANRATPPPEHAWTIPFQRNGFFLGQEQVLTQLHQRLAGGTTTALTQIQAISGLGGIGKTQIAIEYAFRYRASYPFVFWIRSEHIETLLTDLVSLASLLQLPEQYETDQGKVAAAVKQWLATHRSWLLILDNADDLNLVAPYLPERHSGAILLTTRASQTQPLAEPLQVEQMSEQLGAEFLLRRAHVLFPGQPLAQATPADQQAARQLCRLVGGLPLALDQAGAYIDETQCTTQDYLNYYQQDLQVRAKLLQRRGKVTAGHPDPVATTWKLAFTRVEQASPAATELLRACAFLAPDLIPEDMLRQEAQYWGTALKSVASNSFEWNETIGELLKYALMRRSREHKVLSMHRLVQTVIKDAMDRPTYQQWVEHTIQAIEHAFPDGNEVNNWLTCKRLLPHAQTCAVLIEEHDLRSEAAANLLLRIADYLREHAWYSEAEPLYQRVLRIWEQRVGPEHLDVTDVLNNLAILYYNQGKYAEAEPLYQRALRIWEQQLGPGHPEVSYPLIGLAFLYYQQGNYAEAEPLFQRALRICEQQLGPGHPGVSYPLCGLADLYLRQGNHAEAEPLLQRALRICEQQLGPEHPEVAYPLNGLAIIYRRRGNYAEAEPLFQRALRILEQRFGPEHPQVVYSLVGLAILYEKQREYAKAEMLYQRSLSIRKQKLGTEHHLTWAIRKDYAILLRAMGRDGEARRLEEGS